MMMIRSVVLSMLASFKSRAGAPSLANSFHDFDRKLKVS